MSNTVKMKLCWSCEGRVAQDQENCPYCGVYLSPTPLHPGKGDPIVPLYAKDNGFKEKMAPQAPYMVKEPKNQEKEVREQTAQVESNKEILIPLMTLISGAVFFLFGLVLFLFSDQDGHLVLKWNSAFWPFYLSLSAILLFIGWRALGKLSD